MANQEFRWQIVPGAALPQSMLISMADGSVIQGLTCYNNSSIQVNFFPNQSDPNGQPAFIVPPYSQASVPVACKNMYVQPQGAAVVQGQIFATYGDPVAPSTSPIVTPTGKPRFISATNKLTFPASVISTIDIVSFPVYATRANIPVGSRGHGLVVGEDFFIDHLQLIGTTAIDLGLFCDNGGGSGEAAEFQLQPNIEVDYPKTGSLLVASTNPLTPGYDAGAFNVGQTVHVKLIANSAPAAQSIVTVNLVGHFA